MADSAERFREKVAAHATRDPAVGYRNFRAFLPEAKALGQVEYLFTQYLDRHSDFRFEEPTILRRLARQWVADAVGETHEEARMWYSIGMNTVRGIHAGGVTLGHYKIRPGSLVDVTWHDPDRRSPPPGNMQVEIAALQGEDPAAPGGRYRTLAIAGFRPEGNYHVYSKRLDKPGIYRLTVRNEDFFQQSYVQVSWLDMAVKDDGGRFLIWGASPGNRLKPPYRALITGPGGYRKDTLTDASGLLLLDPRKEAGFRDSIRIVLEKDGSRAWSRGAAPELRAERLAGILYTDRPRYRPGDRIHIRGLVKRQAEGHVLADGWKVPLVLLIRDGRGREVFRRAVEVDPWGGFGDSLLAPENAALGSWLALVEPGRERDGRGRVLDPPFNLDLSAGFRVEEFRKPDFRLEGEAEWRVKTGKAVVKVRGAYYNGAAMAGVPVEVRWHALPGFPGPEPDGRFQAYGIMYRVRQEVGRAMLRRDTLRLDARGMGRLEIEAPVPSAGAGGLGAELIARDVTGRETWEFVRAEVDRGGTGLVMETDRFRYQAGDPGWLRIKTQARQGSPLRGKASLRIHRDGKPWLDTSLAPGADGTCILRMDLDRTGRYAARAVHKTAQGDSLTGELGFLVVRMIGRMETFQADLDLERDWTASGDSLRIRARGNWGSTPLLATLEVGNLGAWKVLSAPDRARLAIALPLPKHAARLAMIKVMYPGPLAWRVDSLQVTLPDTALLLKATLEAPRVWKPGERFKGRIRIRDAMGRPAQARFSLGVVDEAIFDDGDEPQGSPIQLLPDLVLNRVRTGLGEEVDDYLWAYSGAARVPRFTGASEPLEWADEYWDVWGGYYAAGRFGRKARRKNRGAHFTLGPATGYVGHVIACDMAFNLGPSPRIEGVLPGTEIPRERSVFKDNAFWAPALATDDQGLVEVEFPWPDDLTRWRLRARGAGPGAALLDFTDTLATRQALSVRLAVPRTFTEGDSAVVHALVRNGTGRTLEAEVGLETGDGAVAVLRDSGVRRLSLKPGNMDLAFPLAILKPGRAELRVTLSTPEGGDAESRTCPVRGLGTRQVTYYGGYAAKVPASSPGAASVGGPGFGSGVSSGGIGNRGVGNGAGGNSSGGNDVGGNRDGTWDLFLPGGYQTGSAELQVDVHSQPLRFLLGPVANLLEYPYGCVEQTMSRFIPLLQVREAFKRNGIRDTLLESRWEPYSRAGIERLESLERAGGGWAWWGSDNLDLSMTALVVEGMDLAARQGLPAYLRSRAETLRDRGIRALEGHLNASTMPSDQLVEGVHAVSVNRKSSFWKPYLTRPWQERGKLDVRTLAPLLELYHAAGMQAEAREVQALLLSRLHLPAEAAYRGAGYRREGDILAVGRALGALWKTDPGHEAIPRLAAWLHQTRQGEGWGSTRATAAILSVLVALEDGRNRDPADGRLTISLNGRILKADTIRRAADGSYASSFRIQGEGLDSLLLPQGANRLVVHHGGEGRLLFGARLICQASGSVTHLSSVSEPLSVKDSSSQGRLSVKRVYRKVWYSKQGDGWVRKTAPLADRPLRQGEEVEVSLEVEATGGGDYVLLEDPFPAGLENLDRGAEWRTRFASHFHSRFDHFEARDDRAVFFQTRLEPGKTVFRYLLRAETPGRFTARPARAELMYEPEIQGASPPATLTVRR